jgi:hypothetical protein
LSVDNKSPKSYFYTLLTAGHFFSLGKYLKASHTLGEFIFILGFASLE